MSKTYYTSEDIKSWLNDHRSILFTDILDSCEAGAKTQKTKILVATVENPAGTTHFNLSDIEDILDSLSKCEKFFVETEDYEKAARTRDCRAIWLKRK